MRHAVIMAGGAGTRFWPASRRLVPKQLLRLAGERTMLQTTVDRLQGLVPDTAVLVLTNRNLVPAVQEQLPQLAAASVIGEPCKRDTAPCIGLAAALIQNQDHDATLIVMPADQLIQPLNLFHAAIRHACQLVEDQPDRIVTFGIRPSYPAETFGYIERGERLREQGPDAAATPTYRVRMFREKPNATVAAEYLASGNFYWNSGIFVWKTQTILAALQTFEPEMHARLQRIADTYGTPGFAATLENEFNRIGGKSIDYAVMERYGEVAVVEAPFAWDDVGSWGSLQRIGRPDAAGNFVEGRHLSLGSHGCIIRGEDDHLIVTLGMQDCIVVHTPDATLIARKSDEESIRKVVGMIEEQGWHEYL